MKVADQVQALLEQEMDRKKFLQVAGAAALGVIGVTKILQSLNGFSPKAQKSQKQLGGYGSTPYGQ